MEGKALRYNEGKPDWTLLDYKSLLPLVDVMTYGATKYDRDNWKLQCDNPNQHLQSCMRHLIALIDGEEFDKESGFRHSGHIMANMMFWNYHVHPEEKKPLDQFEIYRKVYSGVLQNVDDIHA